MITLSIVVAFGGFAHQARAIALLSSCALLYGLPFAWLESGYILLSYDEKFAAPGVYTLLAIIRASVFVVSMAIACAFGSHDIPILQFAIASTGLSCGAAVISGVRSERMDGVAAAYIAGAAAALLTCLVLAVNDAVQIVFVYAVLTGGPVVTLALLRGGKGWHQLARALYAHTKSFVVDQPITAVIENGDRLLLSAVADHASLVTYNAVKVFFGIQRELNKLVKQMMFHRLFEEVRKESGRVTARAFMFLAAIVQIAVVGGGLALHWYVRRTAPEPVYVFVALCISTAYTLLAAQSLSVAKALYRRSSAFIAANVVGLAVASLAAGILFVPVPIVQHIEAACWVAGSYLLFYVAKNAVLRRYLQ